VRCVRTTRSSTYSHSLQVTLSNPQTLSHKSSFIPRASQLWNSLPPTTFPESYNLSSFKSNINKLDLVSFLLKLSLIFSVFPLSGLCYRPYSLSSTLFTKKKCVCKVCKLGSLSIMKQSHFGVVEKLKIACINAGCQTRTTFFTSKRSNIERKEDSKGPTPSVLAIHFALGCDVLERGIEH